MSKTEAKEPLIRESTKHHLVRVALATIPFLPSPQLYDLITDLTRSRESLDSKITKASEALREASLLVQEIETNLTERAEKLTILRQEIERYSQIAEVEENKAKAVIQQLELSLNKGKNQERWVSFVINIIAGIILFLMGVFLSPVINKYIQQDKKASAHQPVKENKYTGINRDDNAVDLRNQTPVNKKEIKIK